MAGVDGGIMFPADNLRGWTQEVFQKIGVSRDDAALLADSLIEANLRGWTPMGSPGCSASTWSGSGKVS
ncbi:MAG: hypothetical protein D4R56_06845 [Deltaproteobacteria bacterium]|nr:MAG: hypothetical protein D4R56_06845 [Deltaproteobacteria bacterium]